MKLHIIFSDVSPLVKTVLKLDFYIKNNLKLCKKFFMFKLFFTVVFIQKTKTFLSHTCMEYKDSPKHGAGEEKLW